MDDDVQLLKDYYGIDAESLYGISHSSIQDNVENDVSLDTSEADIKEFTMIESVFGPTATTCCSQKCNSVLTRECVCTFCDYFNELSKSEQDLIIISHLQSHCQDLAFEKYYNAITRTKYTARNVHKKRSDTLYMFRGVQICLPMYLFIHNLGLKRYRNIVKHFDEKGLSTRSHGLCGKRSNQTRFSPEVRIEIVTYIRNFAEHYAIPFPGRLPQFKNFKVMKLPSCESKISVYRRYVDSCEGDTTKKIGERMFYYLWEETCPFIQTMKPASDLCDTCKENTDKISQAKTEAEREEKLNIAITHLTHAKTQHNYYNECCCDLKMTDNSTVLVISFDFAQNVSYPSGPQCTGQSYFKSARKCNIFGILNEITKIQTNYLIDENEAIGKGPNATVSMLHQYLEANPADGIRICG